MSEQERADLRALAEAVLNVEHGDGSNCPWCDVWKWSHLPHEPTCPVHIARRVLACTPGGPAAIDSEENER